MHLIRSCQWSNRWVGRAFQSKAFNVRSIMEAKFKTEKTSYALWAPYPVFQVTDGNRQPFLNLGHFKSTDTDRHWSLLSRNVFNDTCVVTSGDETEPNREDYHCHIIFFKIITIFWCFVTTSGAGRRYKCKKSVFSWLSDNAAVVMILVLRFLFCLDLVFPKGA